MALAVVWREWWSVEVLGWLKLVGMGAWLKGPAIVGAAMFEAAKVGAVIG